MAEVMKENDTSQRCENSRATRRRRVEMMRRYKVSPEQDKRQKKFVVCGGNSVENSNKLESGSGAEQLMFLHENTSSVKRVGSGLGAEQLMFPQENMNSMKRLGSGLGAEQVMFLKELNRLDDLEPGVVTNPKYGSASVCGRRRDMEDAVAVHPSFCHTSEDVDSKDFHFFGVYDGHGCSHVAMKCRQRLHDLVKEEVLEMKEEGGEEGKWQNVMDKSFMKMEKEIIAWNKSMVGASCRCELRTPDCDAVGSTAVVAVVTPLKIVVANVGDSRAILCRNGKPVPLSIDHKPDRLDELDRIQAAGGRVIYWDGPRVQGMLAMSRAIGDNYLKPYVICEPEVTITERSEDDVCLIVASDGLWDVVSNEMACDIAHTCLKGKKVIAMVEGGGSSSSPTALAKENSDKGCSNVSMLLTKLALAKRSMDNVSVVVIDLRKDA